MKEEQQEFIDAENYQGGSQDKLSFRMIALNQLKKCVELGSTEWCGGYRKAIVSGNATNYTYIPDTRASWINAVKQLNDILLPFFDKLMQKTDTELNQEYEKQYNEFVEEYDKIKSGDKKSLEYKWKWQTKLKLYRKRFRELSNFLWRIKYLEGKKFEHTR